jgi:hypothetical protein
MIRSMSAAKGPAGAPAAPVIETIHALSCKTPGGIAALTISPIGSR